MSARDIRRAAERGHIQTNWLEGYCSFSFGSYQRVDRRHFGALRMLNEDWIASASGFAMHPHENLEILLIPLQSVTAHKDSLGNRMNVCLDELLVMHAGRGICHSQMNASDTEPDHHLRLCFCPSYVAMSPQWRLYALIQSCVGTDGSYGPAAIVSLGCPQSTSRREYFVRRCSPIVY